MYKMLKKVTDFGVIFGALGKGLAEKQNGSKIINTLCKKLTDWKTPGKDSSQVYWIESPNNVHEQIAIKTNKILMGDDSLSAWMKYGRALLEGSKKR